MRASLLTAIVLLGATCADAQTLRVKAPPAPYFRLQLADATGSGKCLEANVLGERSLLSGATFLDRCQPVTGQFWIARTVEKERFRLSAQFGGADRCLSVNEGEIEEVAEGMPYMASCNESGATFEAVAGPSGSYFRLRTTIGARIACLGVQPGTNVADPFLPVLVTPCEGRMDQMWQAVEARLVEGIPVALTAEERRVTALEAPFGAARPADCVWNDGTSDRPLFFPCLFETAPDESRFVVTGPSLSHAFEVEPNDPNAARGFLRTGNTTLPLGRFERREDDGTCWINRQSGERLCVR